MTRAERPTANEARELPKPLLAPVVAELSETARTAFWRLSDELNGDQTKPIPEKVPLKKIELGGNEYEILWQTTTSEPKKNGDNLLMIRGGYVSNRVYIASGDKLLVMSYGRDEKTGSLIGASISFSEKGRQPLSNNEAAVREAKMMLNGVIRHYPHGEIPVLEETNKLLLGRPQAA